MDVRCGGGVPKTENTIKLQVDELPDDDRKDFLFKTLSSITSDLQYSDISSFRTYVKKNEIVVTFHEPISEKRDM